MRVAVAHWTRQMIGGAEAYIDALIPALIARGVEVGFWHEVDGMPDRGRIADSCTIESWSAARLGTADATASLVAWDPSIIFVNTVYDIGVESTLTRIAPAMLFAHTYHGTCVSGRKALSQPELRPCHHRFDWRCLFRYFPCECGPRTMKTLLRDYIDNARRLDVSRQYAAIVTASEHMRSEYARQGFPPEKLRKIPLYVPHPLQQSAWWRRSTSTDSPHAGRAGLPKLLPDSGRGPTPIRLLFLGRMDELKGGDVFLDALPRAAELLGAPLDVTFAGDGPARSDWERLGQMLQSRQPGLDITFTGWITGTAKEDLLAKSHLLVVPSLWPEPFGMVGVEAARHGVPSAAFAVGGIPEWLTEGATGHLAPTEPPTANGLAEAIVSCVQDPEHYTSLSRGALEMSTQFSREQHVSELLRLFQQLMSLEALPETDDVRTIPRR